MSDLSLAIILATRAHAGQVDRGGAPYILHPLRVMLQMDTEAERVVAVLHDVLEDTDVTLPQLTAAGFSAAILDALYLLTRVELNQSVPGRSLLYPKRYLHTYEEYIERIKGNALARKVKLADLVDNSDLDRIPKPTANDRARQQKYLKAHTTLLG